MQTLGSVGSYPLTAKKRKEKLKHTLLPDREKQGVTIYTLKVAEKGVYVTNVGN